MDKTSIIFNNKIDNKTIKSAEKSKKKFIKQFGDDSLKDYKIGFKENKTLNHLGVKEIVFKENNEEFDKDALIVGNIRMGFGHYRISIALASCAKAMGYNPYWLDLASFDATGSKMIRKQNDMYSLASKISQKSKLFNHFVWEPLNSEGFKKIEYNAKDQKNSELLVPIFRNIPKDIPYIATHVWPSQGAIHSGMKNVVNAIPDNWPMGLHLSEGAIHTVQTPFAYYGYKTLNGFSKKELNGMSDKDIKEVGCYVDHELLINLENDNLKRLDRLNNNKPLRILLSVGGAGAGTNLFISLVKFLLPYVNDKKVCLFMNFGDHKDVYEIMKKKIPSLNSVNYFDKYDEFLSFVDSNRDSSLEGIYTFYNKDIFEAVYSTNVLMRISDLLITKPSELVFYPIPKLFMKHIGGHEVYGGRFGHEMGDAFKECEDSKSLEKSLKNIINDKDLLKFMISRINELYKQGHYDGGYKICKILKENQDKIL